jgi:hypothetical protein
MACLAHPDHTLLYSCSPHTYAAAGTWHSLEIQVKHNLHLLYLPEIERLIIGTPFLHFLEIPFTKSPRCHLVYQLQKGIFT